MFLTPQDALHNKDSASPKSEGENARSAIREDTLTTSSCPGVGCRCSTWQLKKQRSWPLCSYLWKQRMQLRQAFSSAIAVPCNFKLSARNYLHTEVSSLNRVRTTTNCLYFFKPTVASLERVAPLAVGPSSTLACAIRDCREFQLHHKHHNRLRTLLFGFRELNSSLAFKYSGLGLSLSTWISLLFAWNRSFCKFIQHEHRDSSSSRIRRSTMLPICAIVLRVRHPPQPLPLPNPGPNSGVRGVRRGRMCGMACGRIRVLLPPLEGPPHYGPSCGGGLPPRGLLFAHLNCQSTDFVMSSLEKFWWVVLVISSLCGFD